MRQASDALTTTPGALTYPFHRTAPKALTS